MVQWPVVGREQRGLLVIVSAEEVVAMRAKWSVSPRRKGRPWVWGGGR